MKNARAERLLVHLYSAQVQRLSITPPPQPPEAHEELRRLGLTDDAGALTEEGRRMGRDAVRRHRLAEALLHNVLSVVSDEVHSSACELEHMLRRGLDEKICVLLGHPSACPHGRPIPPGECCTRAATSRREVGPLSEAPAGAAGVVAYLATADTDQTQKLMAMGVLPGARITVVRQSPCHVFRVDFSEFAVDDELAGRIYVHWLAPAPQPEPCRRRRRFWGGR